MAKNIKESSDPKANVAEALSKTELFLNRNKKTIAYAVGCIIALAALFLIWKNLIVQPKQREAENQSYIAERYFRADSFNLALNGDGNALGFKQVIDKYGSKAGGAVYYYAGVCYLRLGEYDKAIEYLKKYNEKDSRTMAKAKACIGDALVNKGELKEAADWFEKAAALSDDVFSAGYLIKCGLCYEELQQPEKALAAYKKIKNQYVNSPEGADIDKYIARVEASLNK